MNQLTPNAAAPHRPRRRHGKQTRFLSQSIVLEEIGPPSALRMTLLLACAAILALIGWAYVSPLSERVNAAGQVVPNGSVVLVQHWEGGIVSELPVREGALVERGDVLVRLDVTASTAEYEEARTRMAALALRVERLRAFAEGRALDFRAIDPTGQYADLAADQRQIHQLQLRKRDSERRVLNLVIEQRTSELAALRSEEETLAEETKIIEELAEMRSTLAAKGLISKSVHLGTMQELVSSKGALQKVRTQATQAEQAIAEAREKLEQLDSELFSAALAEMGQAAAELAQLKRAAEKARDRVERLEITAPVRGLVKSITANAVGGVIPPGSEVAEIVPIDEDLVAEVRIAPEDIGQLVVGQAVSVKVSAYDHSRHGTVDGTLRAISPSTFEDEDGTIYYKGTVRLARGYVGGDQTANPILPGMTIDADIRTGERTVLQYLLKPVYVSVTEAFGER